MKSKIHRERLSRLRRLLKERQIPSLLVSNPTNVTYLTGFTGDATYLVVTAKDAVLISDSRFATQIEEECPGLAFEIKGDSGTTVSLIAEWVAGHSIKQLGIEAQHVSKASFDDWSERMKSASLLGTSGIVETLRSVKDASELERIRKSIRINERAFEIVRSRLRGDQTELEIGHSLEQEMRLLGATGCAFPPIVGVGARAALPHAVLTDQQIGDSPFVLVDWGARYEGYASDLTRMIVTGPVPARFRKIYEVVREAQLAAIALIRPGQDCQVVDRAAREHIHQAGFGKHFGHGLGHGFGLQVHEAPYFSPSRAGRLEEGMVVTVEPGIYLPGFGGVRLEDDILVTGDGHERLSSLPTDFDAAQWRLL